MLLAKVADLNAVPAANSINNELTMAIRELDAEDSWRPEPNDVSFLTSSSTGLDANTSEKGVFRAACQFLYFALLSLGMAFLYVSTERATQCRCVAKWTIYVPVLFTKVVMIALLYSRACLSHSQQTRY